MIKAASFVVFRRPPLKTFNRTFHDIGSPLLFPPQLLGMLPACYSFQKSLRLGFLVAPDWLFLPSWSTAHHKKCLGTLAMCRWDGELWPLPMQPGSVFPLLAASCQWPRPLAWKVTLLTELQKTSKEIPWLCSPSHCGWVGFIQSTLMSSNDSSLIFICLHSTFLTSFIVQRWRIK